MASKIQANEKKTIAKGSYRSYTSFLKQYSASPKTKEPLPTDTISHSTRNGAPTQPRPPVGEVENGLKHQQTSPVDMVTIETLLALTNGQIDLLDVNVLKQFLDILTKENAIRSNGHTAEPVDANNNAKVDSVPSSLDIDQSKRNLIESLKAQLQRYRTD